MRVTLKKSPAGLSLLIFCFLASGAPGPTKRVTGVLIDSYGRPVSGGEIRFSPQVSGKNVLRSTSLADGSFTVNWADESSGLYSVQISAPGHRTIEPVAAVESLMDLDLGILEIPAGRIIGGRVIDESGRPVAGAQVTFKESEPADHILGATALTGLDGAYEVADAPERVARMVVRASRFVISDSAEIRQPVIMRRGAAIEGVIVEPAGEPAPLCTVTAGEHEVKSDASGKFRIEGIAPGNTIVKASCGDWYGLTTARTSLAAYDRVVLKLRPAAKIQGLVSDTQTGKPVSGSSVRVYSGSAFRTFTTLDEASATSDAQGHFRISMAPGSYVIDVTHAGYVRTFKPGVQARSSDTLNLSLALNEEAVLSGKVLDGDGRPLAAARLMLREAGELRQFARVLSSGTSISEVTRSARDGRFIFRGLIASRGLRLSTDHEGFASRSLDGLEVEAGKRHENVIVQLHHGFTATGMVTDEDGHAISRAEIRIKKIEQKGSMPFQSPFPDHGDLAASSGGDGRFVLSELDAGSYSLEVTAKNRPPVRIPQIEIEAGIVTKLEPIKIGPGAKLAGRVVGSGDMRALPGVAVHFGRNGDIDHTATAEDGSFSIAGLPPGEALFVSFRSEGRAELSQILKAPASDIVIQLPRGGTLTGRVTDIKTGQPVTDFTVERSAVLAGMIALKLGKGSGTTFHSEDGQFEMSNLPPGQCRVVVRASGFRKFEISPFNLLDNAVNELTVSMDRGSSVRGRVLEPNSRLPVPNASVTWRTNGAEGESSFAEIVGGLGNNDNATTTDAEGNFTLENIPPAAVIIRATHPDFAPAQRNFEPTGNDPVEIVLGRGAGVEGTVILSSGTPAAQAVVSAWAAGMGASAMLSEENSVADPSGRYSFAKLRPGRYILQAKATAGISSDQAISVGEGELLRSVDLRIASGTTINGMVIGLPDSERANARIMLHGSDFFDSTSAAPDGSFTLRNVRAGVISLTATTSFLGAASSTKSLEIPEGTPSLNVRLEFKGTSRLFGNVSSAGTAIPELVVNAIHDDPALQSNGQTRTDASGHFEIPNLENGLYRVIVIGINFKYEKSVHLAGDTPADIELPDGNVNGSVVDAESHKPLAGATVSAQNADSNLVAPMTAVTDPDGHYSIARLPTGQYTLHVRKIAYAGTSSQQSIGSGDSTVNFELHKGDGTDVHAFDASTGQALTSVQIFGVSPAGSLVFTQALGMDSDGHALLASPPAGQYLLVCFSAGYAPKALGVTNFPAASLNIGFTQGGSVELRQPPGQTLRVRLFTSAGVPYPLNSSRMDGFIDLTSPLTVLPHVTAGNYTVVSTTGFSASIVIAEGNRSIVMLDALNKQ